MLHLARLALSRALGLDALLLGEARGLLLFAAALLAKIALSPRLAHYGFALAMPAMLTAVVCLLDWLPRRTQSASASAIRAAALGLLLIVTIAGLKGTAAELGRKTVRVGAGADAFFADDRGTDITAVIAAA